jgi:iron complex outermembrane receptor protein
MQGEYQRNQREGFEYLLPNFNSFSIGTFMSEEYSWNNRFTFNGGVRFDYANKNIEELKEPIYGSNANITRFYQRNAPINRTFYNASGAVGLSYYPSKTLNAKVNLGTSFRVPTAAELSMNGVHHGTFRHELGDSTLKAERGIQADLSVAYQQNHFVLTFTPFISYYKNFIYLAPTQYFSSMLDQDAFPEGGQIYQYRQNNAFYIGGEATLEYHPIKALHLKVAGEYVRNYNFDTQLPLPFTPAPSIFLEAMYHFDGKKVKPNIGVNFKKVMTQNRTDRNERSTEGYHLLGLTAGAEVSVVGLKPVLSITAHNLLNARYMHHLSRYRLLNLPEQGRNITLSLYVPF